MHELIEFPGEGREWLDSESTAANALRDLIFDGRWMKSLAYYVNNRHTGGLEVRMLVKFNKRIETIKIHLKSLIFQLPMLIYFQ